MSKAKSQRVILMTVLAIFARWRFTAHGGCQLRYRPWTWGRGYYEKVGGCKVKVQCFYNVNYNIGHECGQSKFAWGFDVFDLSDEERPLKEQLLKRIDTKGHEVFNLNLTSFTPFPNSVFDRDNYGEVQSERTKSA